jgi:prepilin-type processing-associated H-X9-DG protein
MYSDEHNLLPETYYFDPSGPPNTNVWVRGTMDDSPAFGQVEPGKLDSTNINTIVHGKLYTYNQSSRIYRCPADRSMTQNVPRVRSYSINGWMGGRPLAGQDQFRVFVREADIVDPPLSKAWVLIDEHERSINDGWFAFDMTGSRGFLDVPASRHDDRFNLAFADSHVETWKLDDPRTIRWTTLPISNNPRNADWTKLSPSTSSLK